MFQNIKPISEKSYKVFSYLADAARNSKNHAIKIKKLRNIYPRYSGNNFFHSGV